MVLQRHSSSLWQRKFVPGFTPEFFRQAVQSVDAATLPLAEGQTVEQLCEEVFPVIFDPTVMPKRVNQAAGEDLVLTSACNYYDGVTQQEAEDFYNALKNPQDETPVSYGLNSRLVKEDGKIQEKVWKVGGLYGQALAKDCLLAEEGRRSCRDSRAEGGDSQTDGIL